MPHVIPTYSSRASLHSLSACTPTDIELLRSLILLANGSPLDPVRSDSTASSGSGTTNGTGDSNEALRGSPPTPRSLRYHSPTEMEGTGSSLASFSSPPASGSRVAQTENESVVGRGTKPTAFMRMSYPARNIALKAAHAESKDMQVMRPSPELMVRTRREGEEEQHRRRLDGVKEEVATRALVNAPLVDTVDNVPLYSDSGDDESEEEVQVISVDSDGESNNEQVEVVSGDDNSSNHEADKEGWQDLCAVSIDAYGFGVPFEIRCERSESVLGIEIYHRQIPKTFEERRQLRDAANLLLDMRDKALNSHEKAQIQDGEETESEGEREGEGEREDLDDRPASQAKPTPFAEYLATGTQAVVNGRLVLILNTPRPLHLATPATTLESDVAREPRLETDRAGMPHTPLQTLEPPSKGGKLPVRSPTPASRKRKQAPVKSKTASGARIEDFAAEASSGLVIAEYAGSSMAEEMSVSIEAGSGERKRKRLKSVAVEKVKEEKVKEQARSRGGKGRVLKKTKKFGEE